jgi:hypothetical protein
MMRAALVGLLPMLVASLAPLAASAAEHPRIVIDTVDAANKERSSRLDRNEALRLATEAFATDQTGSGSGDDSVVGLVLSQPENFGLTDSATARQASDALRKLLADDPDAEIVLLSPATLAQDAYRFPPEYGDSTDDNWVFRVILPNTLDVLIWTVVPEPGGRAPYAYTFE